MNVSVLHQEEGGIGKSIPAAQDFPRASPSGLGVQNPWPREILGVGDGVYNTSLLLVEHRHSLIITREGLILTLSICSILQGWIKRASLPTG